jgi:hypothetical protein
MEPVTDPHQLLVLTAVRSFGIAFSALPDAPVLPVTEPRLVRLRRALRRARPALPARRRPVRARRPAMTTGPAPCR